MNNNSGGNSPSPGSGAHQPPQYYQQPPAPQYQPPQYYQQPPAPQYQPPQYYQQPPAPQYQPPQYYQQPPAPQYQPPQYYQQANQGMYYIPLPLNYPIPTYYYSSPQEINKQLFKKHCSRVGLMLMADTGIMLAAQIVIMIVGFIGYMLFRNTYFQWVDQESAIANITMFSVGLSAIISHMIPACAHAHKWRIKFTDPFRGDKLSASFIAGATVTALGLNSIWGYAYYFFKSWLDGIFQFTETATENYTPEKMPIVGFILMVVWTCVIAPFTEEYLFRGVIMRTLSKHGAAFGIVMSAMLFGLMHGNMAQTPMTFMIGLIMGYVATKSGNIRQTIFIHMVNNIFATLPEIVMYFCPQYYDYLEYAYLATDLFSMLFAISALIYFAVKHHKGVKSRRLRLQSNGTEISKDESDWAKLEIPYEKRTPQFNLVRNKFGNCFTSGGMIFFIASMVVFIFVNDFLPYLLNAV